ncbi:acyltransferase family protein [Rhodococcus hoagii]|nr:acyltransferase family protein [Prescottella equi]
MKNAAAISGKFRPDIQGMRAVAILLVLVYHAGATFIPGGYVGVDVFFVISGYLITSHLIGELEKRGTIQLGSFWARRMRRLLPASLLVLVATLILARVMLPPLAMGEVSLDAALRRPTWLICGSRIRGLIISPTRILRCFSTIGHSRSKSNSIWCGHLF